MRRDLDLIRKMLLAIEDSPSGWAPDIKIDGYSDVQIGYHAHLMIGAELARGSDVSTMGNQAPKA